MGAPRSHLGGGPVQEAAELHVLGGIRMARVPEWHKATQKLPCGNHSQDGKVLTDSQSSVVL